MEIDLDAMDPGIGNDATGRNDVGAELESGGNADGLDGGVDAAAAGQLVDALGGFAVGAVDGLRRTELARDGEPLVVQIDHDDPGRRIELRREQRRQSYRPRADNGDRSTWSDLAIQHSALESGWEDIAEHHQRLLVHAFRQVIE